MLTKTTSLAAIGPAISLFLSGWSNLQAAAPGQTKFDGSWQVTLDAKEFKNADGSKALPWVIQFPATIKNGSLHGERGTRGKSEFYELTGTVEADGTANLRIDEITGSQKYNISESAKAPAGKGVSYSYQVAAHFNERRGTGKSTSDQRTRIFTFVKQG
jgi:hypothetical protein